MLTPEPHQQTFVPSLAVAQVDLSKQQLVLEDTKGVSGPAVSPQRLMRENGKPYKKFKLL